MDEVFGAILSGNAVFFIDGYNKAMKISSKGYPDMGVSEAESERYCVFQGRFLRFGKTILHLYAKDP